MKRLIEYKMPKKFMQELLKQKKDRRLTNQQYLCKYVQENCGVLGTVVRVIGE